MSTPQAFAHVETFIFDLDNTLYPPHLDLWSQIDDRMRDYISRFLSIPLDEAFRLQKHYYRTYGTSLRGLMIEHGLDAEDFLSFVHDIDHEPLDTAPRLAEALAALPGRKLVLTNGTRQHAHAVLRRLGLESHIEDSFGIIEAGFMPKPQPAVYEAFLRTHAIDPTTAAMFEDMPRNLEAPAALGMTTVLVVPDGSGEVIREAWEHEGRDAPHIHHVTDNLHAFLKAIAPRANG